MPSKKTTEKTQRQMDRERHDKFVENAYKIIQSIGSGNYKSPKREVKNMGGYIQASRISKCTNY